MPAIDNLRDNVTLTGSALNLLDCFQEGFDDFVLELAESYARLRLSAKAGVKPSAIDQIEIEAQDINAAGTHLMKMLRQQIQSGVASPALDDALTSMDNCLSCKQQ